jgi:RNA polymerase sigma-70 factor (ECF subfamily)
MSEDRPNHEWCEALYDAQAVALLLYGRALGLGHEEAEDVLHEVFSSLLKISQCPEDPQRYLIRAYRNRANNRHRSLWRRLKHEFESVSWFEPSSDRSPAEIAAMRCLAKLPTEQREIIVLKVWNEQTFEEIGELLGISPNTAAGRYRYGLQKLRQCLQQQSEDELYDYERANDSGIAFLDAARPLTRG